MTPITIDRAAALGAYVERLTDRQERIYGARVAAHLEEGARIDSAYLRTADHRAGVGLIRARQIRADLDTINRLTAGIQSEPAEPGAAYGERLTTIELRRALAAAGVTEFETMAGWRPVAEFDPYGMTPPDGDTPAGVNWRHGDSLYHGRIVSVDGRPAYVIDSPDAPARPPFLLGRFPVR